MRSATACRKCSINGCAYKAPSGATKPDIAVICGYPLWDDCGSTEAFSGENGRLLKQIVSNAIIEMNLPESTQPTVGYSNAVCCAPPFDKKTKKYQVSVENVECCKYTVQHWLDDIRPKAILALGADAIKVLGYKDNIRDVRGSLLSFTTVHNDKIPVVPSYHIANIIRDNGLYLTFVKDIRKAVRLSIPDFKFSDSYRADVLLKPDEIVARLEAILALAEQIPQDSDKKVGLAVDTETTSLTPQNPEDRVIAISMSYEPYVGFSYPFEHRAVPFAAEEFKRVFDATEKVLSHPKVKLIGCNGKFDYKWLRYHYGMRMHEYGYDCQLAEHSLDEDKKGEYSLKDLTRDYLPGLGNYEKELTTLRMEAQAKFDEEWKAQDDVWRESMHRAVLDWWLGHSEEERTQILSGWIDDGLATLSDSEALVRVKQRRCKGQWVITKKYADTVYKTLRSIPNEKCPGLVIPERQHGWAPRKHTFEDVDPNVMFKYAALDAITTWLIKWEQRAGFAHDRNMLEAIGKTGYKINTKSAWWAFENITMPLSHVLGHMEYYGVTFDRDRCNAYKATLEETIARLKDQLYQDVGYKFSLSSSAPDLAKILYEDKKLPVLKRTESGAPSTDAATLKDLSDQYDVPLVNTLLVYRKLDKCLHTYLNNWLKMSESDGKLHCSFNQIGTATYRLSSNNPNLQNVPFALKEANLNLKSLFLPDSEEYDLYDLDISNAEMRVLTAYSKDEALINAFNTGKDLHCLTAAGISDYTYEDLLAHKEDKTTDQYRKRQLAKKVNFGTIYCVGPETLKQQIWSEMRLDESVEQCQQYLDDFFKTYPGVKRYIDETKEFVSKNRFTYTFTGRRRRFDLADFSYKLKARTERQAVNARIQTTSSDMVTTNIVDVHNAILPLGGRVLLTVHDSIVFQLPKGTTGLKALLKNLITDKTAERCEWLPVVWKFDCGRGPNYGDTHEEVA